MNVGNSINEYQGKPWPSLVNRGVRVPQLGVSHWSRGQTFYAQCLLVTTRGVGFMMPKLSGGYLSQCYLAARFQDGGGGLFIFLLFVRSGCSVW